MITPNPHHPDRNRFFAGALLGAAIGATIWAVIIGLIVGAVRYVS